MLREAFESLIDALRAACLAHYGERLVSLAVFGSVARGTQRFDSDVDCLLVVRDLPPGRMRRVEEFRTASSARGTAPRRVRSSSARTT